MKLLQENFNRFRNITYRLYELESGVKLVHLTNPATVNFDIAIIHKAGSSYETQEKVPHGTAHLLEHMLFKPNSKFKTIEEISQFEEGNLERPSLIVNATTGKRFLTLQGYSQKEGTERLIERVGSMVEFSPSSEKYFTMEKEIVSAEKNTSGQQSSLFPIPTGFLLNKTLPEFCYSSLGDSQSIAEIKFKDIKTFFQKRFVRENVIFAIQSSDEKLKDSIIAQLEKIAQKYPTKTSKPLREVQSTNILKLNGICNSTRTAAVIELFTFIKDLSYKQQVENDIMNKLLKKLLFDKLRKEEGLIYRTDIFYSEFYSKLEIIRGLSIIVENLKISLALESLYKLIFNDLENFIKSESGTRWLKHILSSHIFPTTAAYDSTLAEKIATRYVNSGIFFCQEEYTEEIRKIDTERLLRLIHEFQKTPPHIWIESRIDRNEIEKAVKSSSLWKQYSK